VEHWVAIKSPDESFPAITEKIVCGLAFREEGAFIEPSQKIECHLANEEGLGDLKEFLAKRGKEFKREPGLAPCLRPRAALAELMPLSETKCKHVFLSVDPN